MVIKALGTMKRVYNPGAEVPLRQKLGPWLKSDRHIHYRLIRNIDACFVQKDGTWIRFKWNSRGKVDEKEGRASVDIRKCNPVEGQIEDQVVYTHFKYNMEKYQMQNGHERLEARVINKVEPQETGTQIYSDGSSFMEERKGACVAIVNKGGKHFVGTGLLINDQGKNSYRAELEGIYLGSKIDGKGENNDKRWEFWTDSKAAIVQYEKKF